MIISIQDKPVPHEVRVALIDLDGTAARCTDRINLEATAMAFDAWGLTVTEQQYSCMARGRSRQEGIRLILIDGQREDLLPRLEQIAVAKNNIAQRLRENLCPADVPPLDRLVLKELRHRGLLLAIGTSSRNALDTLNRLQLTRDFDVVVTGNEAREKEDIWRLALSYFKARPDEAMVFEDAQVGIDEAVKLGVSFSIGIGDPGLKATVYSPTLGALQIR